VERGRKQLFAAVGLSAVLVLLYFALLLVLSAACTDGFYTRTRSRLCEATTSENAVTTIVLTLVPGMSVAAVGLAARSRRAIYGHFGAWFLVALTAGTVILLIRNGHL
jgi:hypothetical protein